MMAFLLHLAGAAALLLFAVRMIRTGVERAFMARLRLILRRSEEQRGFAALCGAGAAMLLQSSTAVALIAAGFAVSGGLSTAAGLSLILGADLGSAIAAQILLARAGWLVPLLLLAGVALFLKGKRRPVRQTGRILTGLALVFVSIDMIRAATAPLQHSEAVGFLVSYLDGDAVSAFVIGAVLAYAVHSSLAAVLMFVTFVAAGVLSVPAGAALVLGANFGGAAIPVILSLSMPPEARRMVLANLVLRGGGALLALAALAVWRPDLSLLGTAAHTQVINLHLAFNLCLVVIGLIVAGPVAALAIRMLPDEAVGTGASTASALDTDALDTPQRALACSGREVLSMGEEVAAMLAPALRLYRHWDDAVAQAIEDAEDRVDAMHFETKLYIANLQERPLTPTQARRALDLATFANNLEDAGDQISTNMLDMARRMQSEGLRFSDDGWRDLQDFHDRVSANAQLALNVMMSGESEVARQLLEEKDKIRQLEMELQSRHLERLRLGAADSIETSNLHQETLRALKQINSALSWVATPIAEESGDLKPSRLSGGSEPSDKPPHPRKSGREARI